MPTVLPAGTMHRLACGSSLVKLLSFDEPPPAGVGGAVADCVVAAHQTNDTDGRPHARQVGFERLFEGSVR